MLFRSGGDPRSPASLPVVQTHRMDGNVFEVSFIGNPQAAGVTWTLERSERLSEWSTVESGDGGVFDKSIRVDVSDAPAAYFRLRLE